MTTAGLPSVWRERAELLEHHGAVEAAATLRVTADELEVAIAHDADAELTLSEAASESGYSERRLRQLVRAGEIEDHGRPGAPRLRRGDLPRRRRRAPGGAYDPSAHAADILAHRRPA